MTLITENEKYFDSSNALEIILLHDKLKTSSSIKIRMRERERKREGRRERERQRGEKE